MKRFKSFIRNNYARVPFSVIGVFLILGSSITTVYVAKLETEKTFELADTVDFNEVDNLLRLAEADMATALNIAGLKGLKKIGQTPVLEVDSTIYGDNAEDVNKNLVCEIIQDEMNIYLTGNYLYELFNDGKYAVNILIPDGQKYPVYSWDMISFQENGEIKIHVYKDNTIWLNGIPLTADELKVHLINAHQLNPHTSPQIFHDQEAYFGTYQSVKNAAEAAGFESLDVILKPG